MPECLQFRLHPFCLGCFGFRVALHRGGYPRVGIMKIPSALPEGVIARMGRAESRLKLILQLPQSQALLSDPFARGCEQQGEFISIIDRHIDATEANVRAIFGDDEDFTGNRAGRDRWDF